MEKRPFIPVITRWRCWPGGLAGWFQAGSYSVSRKISTGSVCNLFCRKGRLWSPRQTKASISGVLYWKMYGMKRSRYKVSTWSSGKWKNRPSCHLNAIYSACRSWWWNINTVINIFPAGRPGKLWWNYIRKGTAMLSIRSAGIRNGNSCKPGNWLLWGSGTIRKGISICRKLLWWPGRLKKKPKIGTKWAGRLLPMPGRRPWPGYRHMGMSWKRWGSASLRKHCAGPIISEPGRSIVRYRKRWIGSNWKQKLFWLMGAGFLCFVSGTIFWRVNVSFYSMTAPYSWFLKNGSLPIPSCFYLPKERGLPYFFTAASMFY